MYIPKIVFIILLSFIIISFFVWQKNKINATEINWQMLEQIRFIPTLDTLINQMVKLPAFNNALIKLEGKQVSVTGFYIPMAMNSNKFALSKNPNKSCFFCGRSNIETIMIVYSKDKMIDLDDDEVITIEGKLQLTKSYNDFIYTLKDASFICSNKR